jgi:hypothetical protein
LESTILDFHDLKKLGWVSFDRAADPRLVSRLLRVLRPSKIERTSLDGKSKDDARPNTLSSQYGLSEFPFHTDFAIRDKPARYIILVANRPRIAKTIIFDSNILVEHFGVLFLTKAMFLLRNGSKNYFTSIVKLRDGGLDIRYNSQFMEPRNKQAESIRSFMLEFKFERLPKVDWRASRAVLIDNLRMMHGREAIIASGEISKLRRIAIW